MFTTILENIINSIESIRANKLRSSLSMLWIIIWVCSVIILTAIWNWSQQTILKKIEELWTNILTISSWWNGRVWWKATMWNVLTDKVVKNIQEINWIKSVLPVITSNWQLLYWSNNMSVSVYWVNNDYLPAKNIKIKYWTNITDDNLKSLDKVAVIWQEVLTTLFVWQDPIWKNIKMWSNVFQVIWVIEENSTLWSSIFIPITTQSIRITGQKYYSQIIVLVENSDNIKQNQEDINNSLISLLNITDV